MRLCDDLQVRFDCLSHQFGVSGIRDRTVERQSSQIIYAELEAAVRLSPESESFYQELADAYSAALRTEDAHKKMEICRVLRSRVLRHVTLSVLSNKRPGNKKATQEVRAR